MAVIRGTGTEETEEKREIETKAMTHREKVVSLVREDFRERQLAEEAIWQVVVLIPKGKGEYRGIGLVEVVWKVVAAILNRRLAASITYHNFIHGFWACYGTGAATLKAKLLHQLAAMR